MEKIKKMVIFVFVLSVSLLMYSESYINIVNLYNMLEADKLIKKGNKWVLKSQINASYQAGMFFWNKIIVDIRAGCIKIKGRQSTSDSKSKEYSLYKDIQGTYFLIKSYIDFNPTGCDSDLIAYRWVNNTFLKDTKKIFPQITFHDFIGNVRLNINPHKIKLLNKILAIYYELPRTGTLIKVSWTYSTYYMKLNVEQSSSIGAGKLWNEAFELSKYFERNKKFNTILLEWNGNTGGFYILNRL